MGAKKNEAPKQVVVVKKGKFWFRAFFVLVLLLVVASLAGLKLGFGLGNLIGFKTGGNGTGTNHQGTNNQSSSQNTPENVATLSASVLLKAEHFQDFSGMTTKVRNAKDPVSQYLNQRLTPGTRQLLEKYDSSGYPSQSLEKALLADLNALLLDTNFYDEQRFANVQLTQDTRDLLRESPKGEKRALLNRQLLEEAFSREIAILYAFYFSNDRIFQYNNQITWADFEKLLKRAVAQKERRQEVSIKLVFDAATITNGFQLKVENTVTATGISFAKELQEKSSW